MYYIIIVGQPLNSNISLNYPDLWIFILLFRELILATDSCATIPAEVSVRSVGDAAAAAAAGVVGEPAARGRGERGGRQRRAAQESAAALGLVPPRPRGQVRRGAAQRRARGVTRAAAPARAGAAPTEPRAYRFAVDAAAAAPSEVSLTGP